MFGRENIKLRPMNLELEQSSGKAYERLNKSLEIKVKVSPHELSFIKTRIFRTIERHIQAEENQEKKPTTKAFGDIDTWPEEKLNSFLLEWAIGSYYQQEFNQSLQKYIHKSWYRKLINWFKFKRWRGWFISEKERQKFLDEVQEWGKVNS